MRRSIPIIGAALVAGAFCVPMLTASSSVSAAPCPPDVLPPPANVLILTFDSYTGCDHSVAH